MKFRRILPLLALLPLLAACATSTTGAQPQATPTAGRPNHPQVFSLYPKNPALPHGPPRGWDSRFIDPGAMVYYQGKFHMFYNGITGYPAPVSVGYATSSDGLSWIRVSKNPVLLSSQVSYAPLTIFVSSVLVQPDGTWVMYFYTLESSTAFQGKATIGRATAPAPTGPWKPDAAPVLQPGTSGSWDAMSVANPDVVKTDAGYVMYYNGVASLDDVHGAIGMATSPDGIHWTKYNNPATSDTLYAESDPVLLPGKSGTWDAYKMLDANVIQGESGWVMVYLVATGPGGAPTPYSAFGYATSVDGVTWKRSSVNPIVSSVNDSSWLGIFLANLLYHNGTLYLYFDVQRFEDGVGVTNVFLATHQGLLNN